MGMYLLISLLLQTIMVLVRVSCVKIAVYEHLVKSAERPEHMVTRKEALRLMMENLEVYNTQAELASKQGTKLIVFPEYGIYSFGQTRDSIVPYLEDVRDAVDWNPCTNPGRFPNTDIQHSLSCIAKNNSIYVVANLGDIKYCNKSAFSNCPKDKRYQFNTNVVYDSSGKFLTRYHKRHLWDEALVFNQALFPEIAIIETPFGRFGMVICADIYFHTPTEDLFTEFGIQNLLVSSAWSVDYTYQASLQAFSGLAKRHNATVIVANILNKKNKMAGSGIFSAPFSLELFTDLDYNKTDGRLLIADVQTQYQNNMHDTKQNTGKKEDGNLQKLHYIDMKSPLTPKVNLNGSWTFLWGNEGHDYGSYGNINCTLDYKFRVRFPDELFGMFIIKDVVNESSILRRQLCGMIKCRTNDPMTCGQETSSVKSTLKYIKIDMSLGADLVFPHVTTIRNEKEAEIDVELGRYSFEGHSGRYVLESTEGFVNPFLASIIYGNDITD